MADEIATDQRWTPDAIERRVQEIEPKLRGGMREEASDCGKAVFDLLAIVKQLQQELEIKERNAHYNNCRTPDCTFCAEIDGEPSHE